MQALLIVGTLTEAQKAEVLSHFPGIQTREVGTEALSVERSVVVDSGVRARFNVALPNAKGFAAGNVVLPATPLLLDHAAATEPLENVQVGVKENGKQARGWVNRQTGEKGSSWYKLVLAPGEIAIFGISARSDGKDGAVIDSVFHIGALESGRTEAKLAEVKPMFASLGKNMLTADPSTVTTSTSTSSLPF